MKRALTKRPTRKVRPIPRGYRSVTPYLVVKGAAALFGFLKAAFGAKELVRHGGPDGRIMHAEVQIGDSRVMLADAPSEPSAAVLHLYVPDVDATYRAALKAGAASVREPADQFYGDRNAGVKDPGGNLWWISTHVEDVSAEELERRQRAMHPKKS